MNTVTTRILLAGDDRLLSKAAAAAWRRRGFEVLQAADGELRHR